MQRRQLLALGTLITALGSLLLPAAGQAGGGPAFTWTPTTSSGTYDYGTLDAGAGASTSVRFTLTNSGANAGKVTVTLSGAAAFTKTADSCDQTRLGHGKSCAVTVEYAPSSNGASDSATLTATTKNATSRLALSGASGTPSLIPSPADEGCSLPSGEPCSTSDVPEYTQGLGFLSTTTFTVTNVGDASTGTLHLYVEQVNNGSFVIDSDQCSGGTLAPGASCTFTVGLFAENCGATMIGQFGFGSPAQPQYFILETISFVICS